MESSVVMRRAISARGRALVLGALIVVAAMAMAARAGAAGSDAVSGGAAPVFGGEAPPTGGAPIGGLAPNHARRKAPPPPPTTTSGGSWITDATITEYWPAPEAWFVGRLVKAPGLTGLHRVDWLYSASGVSMQGEGYGLDGRMYHINALGNGGWVTATGLPTAPSNGWKAGTPFWRAGGFWRNPLGAVSFPLGTGGWFSGAGRYVPLPGVTFATGASLPLRFYQSVAVDPKVIPLGSRVYIPAYSNDGDGGWFIAQDTGGAITGHHIDVYRTPPAIKGAGGRYLTRQRVLVIKPHE
jgi:3D (Asp-Asp-Asp) domain-containing protein